MNYSIVSFAGKLRLIRAMHCGDQLSKERLDDIGSLSSLIKGEYNKTSFMGEYPVLIPSEYIRFQDAT